MHDSAMFREHSRFQLEATRLGRTVIFQVTVFEKEERQRKRLFAETQCTDPLHFMLQFIVRDAADFDDLLSKFLAELEFRGFEPLRYRLREGAKWREWQQIASPSADRPGRASNVTEE